MPPVKCRFIIPVVVSATVILSATGPKFDVASLKPLGRNPSDRFSGGPGSATPDRASWGRVSVRNLISTAWNIPPDRISGAPGLETEYSLDVRYPRGAGDADFRHMVGELLVDRFNIKTHTERKVLKGYELKVAPGGVKFQTAKSAESAPAVAVAPGSPVPSERDSRGFPILKPGSPGEIAVVGHTARMTWATITITEFTRKLNGALYGFNGLPPDMEIVDRTGLKGIYQFQFETPVPAARPLPGELELILQHGGTEPEPADLHAAARVVSSALQKQLGLRLNPATVQVEFLVVEHIDRTPRPN